MLERKLVIGLTGGIGSGKSLAANMFAEFGATVVDTDAIAHELTRPNGIAMPAIVASFGNSYADSSGGLDRPAMRDLVFSEPKAKHRLEAILHPLIKRAATDQLIQANGPYSILVVPLLIESGSYRNEVDRVLVIDCNEQTQLARTMARSALSEEAVRAIMMSQATRAERLALADDVIDNNGDLANLRSQAHSLHRRYLALTPKSRTKDQK